MRSGYAVLEGRGRDVAKGAFAWITMAVPAIVCTVFSVYFSARVVAYAMQRRRRTWAAAVVLGVWSILGSLLTYWSIINGILGLALGVWGLTSKRPRTAWIGIVLCLIGTFLSTVSVGELITNYWNAAKDSYVP